MIFSRELKSNISKILSWAFVCIILIALLLSLYPAMMIEVNMKSIFDGFISSLSPNLKNIFGFEENIDYANLGEYISFIYQYIAVLLVIFAMQLGANALSKEQEFKSIGYIYSNPISRSEIVTQKLFASILSYFLLLLILFGATFGILNLIPLEGGFDTNEILIGLIKIFAAIFVSGLVYMSIGYFLSAIANSSSFADGTSVIFVLLTVAFIIIGKIYGGTFFLIIDNFSLEVFKPFRILVNNISLIGIAINFAILILFILLTYLIYDKKELKY